MRKSISTGLAYWFLKTGSLDEAYSKVQGGIPDVSTKDMFVSSSGFSAAIDFWLTRFRENGMSDGFKLNDAEKVANKVISDLIDRMEHATSDEYPALADKFINMMAMFGGNWSGYERQSTPQQLSISSTVFQGNRHYLDPGKELLEDK